MEGEVKMTNLYSLRKILKSILFSFFLVFISFQGIYSADTSFIADADDFNISATNGNAELIGGHSSNDWYMLDKTCHPEDDTSHPYRPSVLYPLQYSINWFPELRPDFPDINSYKIRIHLKYKLRDETSVIPTTNNPPTDTDSKNNLFARIEILGSYKDEYEVTHVERKYEHLYLNSGDNIDNQLIKGFTTFYDVEWENPIANSYKQDTTVKTYGLGNCLDDELWFYVEFDVDNPDVIDPEDALDLSNPLYGYTIKVDQGSITYGKDNKKVVSLYIDNIELIPIPANNLQSPIFEATFDKTLNSIDGDKPTAYPSLNSLSYEPAFRSTGINLTNSQQYLFYNKPTNYNFDTGTIEFWFRPYWDANDSVKRTFFVLPADSEDKFNYIEIYRNTDNTLIFQIQTFPDENYKHQVVSSADLSSWNTYELHHIAVMWCVNWDENLIDYVGYMRIIVDGENDDIAEQLYPWCTNIQLRQQFYLSNLSDYPNAVIDEFKIYDRMIDPNRNNITDKYQLYFRKKLFTEEQEFLDLTHRNNRIDKRSESKVLNGMNIKIKEDISGSNPIKIIFDKFKELDYTLNYKIYLVMKSCWDNPSHNQTRPTLQYKFNNTSYSSINLSNLNQNTWTPILVYSGANLDDTNYYHELSLIYDETEITSGTINAWIDSLYIVPANDVINESNFIFTSQNDYEKTITDSWDLDWYDYIDFWLQTTGEDKIFTVTLTDSNDNKRVYSKEKGTSTDFTLTCPSWNHYEIDLYHDSPSDEDDEFNINDVESITFKIDGTPMGEPKLGLVTFRQDQPYAEISNLGNNFKGLEYGQTNYYYDFANDDYLLEDLPLSPNGDRIREYNIHYTVNKSQDTVTIDIKKLDGTSKESIETNTSKYKHHNTTSWYYEGTVEEPVYYYYPFNIQIFRNSIPKSDITNYPVRVVQKDAEYYTSTLGKYYLQPDGEITYDIKGTSNDMAIRIGFEQSATIPIDPLEEDLNKKFDLYIVARGDNIDTSSNQDPEDFAFYCGIELKNSTRILSEPIFVKELDNKVWKEFKIGSFTMNEFEPPYTYPGEHLLEFFIDTSCSHMNSGGYIYLDYIFLKQRLDNEFPIGIWWDGSMQWDNDVKEIYPYYAFDPDPEGVSFLDYNFSQIKDKKFTNIVLGTKEWHTGGDGTGRIAELNKALGYNLKLDLNPSFKVRSLCLFRNYNEAEIHNNFEQPPGQWEHSFNYQDHNDSPYFSSLYIDEPGYNIPFLEKMLTYKSLWESWDMDNNDDGNNIDTPFIINFAAYCFPVIHYCLKNDYLNVFSSDSYPATLDHKYQGELGDSTYFDYAYQLEYLSDIASKNNLPYWEYIYGYNANGHREPSKREERCINYLALASGAKGAYTFLYVYPVGFWYGLEGINNFTHGQWDPELGQSGEGEVTKINQELNYFGEVVKDLEKIYDINGFPVEADYVNLPIYHLTEEGEEGYDRDFNDRIVPPFPHNPEESCYSYDSEYKRETKSAILKDKNNIKYIPIVNRDCGFSVSLIELKDPDNPNGGYIPITVLEEVLYDDSYGEEEIKVTIDPSILGYGYSNYNIAESVLTYERKKLEIESGKLKFKDNLKFASGDGQIWRINKKPIFYLKCDENTNGADGEIRYWYTDTITYPGARQNNGMDLTNAGGGLGYYVDQDSGPGVDLNFNKVKGTISFWIKPNWGGSESTLRFFFLNGTWNGSEVVYDHFRLGKDTNNNLSFQIKDSTNSWHSITWNGIQSWNAGEWHYIVAVWDTTLGFMKLYIDGIRVDDNWGNWGVQHKPWNCPSNTSPYFWINYWGWRPNAVLDEYKIFDYCLSDNEIKAEYCQPIFYLRFNNHQYQDGLISEDGINSTPSGHRNYFAFVENGRKNKAINLKSGATNPPYTYTPSQIELSYDRAGNFDPVKGTIELWIKPNWNSQDNSSRFFFVNGSGGLIYNFFRIFKQNYNPGENYLSFQIRDSSNNWHSITWDGLQDWCDDSDRNWHHIAAIWDTRRGFMKLYVDGEQVSWIINTGTQWSLPTPDSNFSVNYWGYYPNAEVDELKVFDIVRDEYVENEEIKINDDYIQFQSRLK